MEFIYILMFCVALAVLVKGADWFLFGAEKIGVAANLPPFVIGVLFVGLGTSLPEIIAALFAVFFGVKEVVVANAVGSNITNILLVVAVTVILSKKLSFVKDLIDIEIPFILTTTGIFLGMAFDGVITPFESILLLIILVLYITYLLKHEDHVPAYIEPIKKINHTITKKDIGIFFIGIAFTFIGAHFLIKSLIELASTFNISEGVIAITAVAIGTSLPELFISIKAGLQGKGEVVLGNIFGSNVFNLTAIIGIPGVFATLPIDEKTFSIGIPTLIIATLLISFSSLSKKIHRWEGVMFIIAFILFIKILFT